MTQKTIWVVAAGAYSNYSVLCACQTKQDAEALVARMVAETDNGGWYSDARAECLPVVTGDVEKIVLLTKSTDLFDNGDEIAREDRRESVWPFDSANACAWSWTRSSTPDRGHLNVRGFDHERVHKVFSERRAMLIADGALRAQKNAKGRR